MSGAVKHAFLMGPVPGNDLSGGLSFFVYDIKIFHCITPF